MMRTLRILGKRGRITIPYEIRQRLGFRPNDVLSFQIMDDRTVLVRRERLCNATRGGQRMKENLRILMVEPRKAPYEASVPHELTAMQQSVGGLIEVVRNDDGVMVDFIFGPAFICDCRGENLDSLSDEQIDRYGKMFRYPEHLARVNDTLLGIPYRPQPEQER